MRLMKISLCTCVRWLREMYSPISWWGCRLSENVASFGCTEGRATRKKKIKEDKADKRQTAARELNKARQDLPPSPEYQIPVRKWGERAQPKPLREVCVRGIVQGSTFCPRPGQTTVQGPPAMSYVLIQPAKMIFIVSKSGNSSI